MKRSTFKAVERAIASHLGGKRVPVTGRHSGDVEDIEHEHYAIEVKARAAYPAVLTLASKQAKLAGKKGGKVPMVVIHKYNTAHDEDMVMLRMADFVKLGFAAGKGHDNKENAGQEGQRIDGD